MSKKEPKTKRTEASVDNFIKLVGDKKKQEVAQVILELMKEVTGNEPKMWGSSIVGFGSYHYRYASGQEGEWPLIGFSPRKQNLTLYIMPGFEKYPDLLKNLGKFKTGKSCLYIKELNDIDLAVLKQLMKQSVLQMKKTHGV